MKGLLILVFIALSIQSNAQIQFYKQYSNNGYDYGEGVVELDDTSYLVTGSSSSFTDGPAQAFLLKTDSLGNFLWSKHYGGNESEGGRRVLDLGSEGAFIAGYTNSFGFGSYDMYLIKTDAYGNQEWSNTYGTTTWDNVYDAALTRDSGVIMVGETRNTLDNKSDIYIVRTDSEGLELWSYQLENEGSDVAKAIDQIDDTTFAVAGSIYVNDSAMVKGMLMRIQDDGTVLWRDTLGNNGAVEFNAVVVDGSKITTGGKLYISYEDQTFGSYYTQSLSDQTFIGEEIDLFNPNLECMALVPYGVGAPHNYLDVAHIENASTWGGQDVATYFRSSSLIYAGAFGSVNYEGDEVLGQAIRTRDAGAILVGSVETVGIGGSNVFLMKMHLDGPNISSDNDFSTTPLVDVKEKAILQGKIYPNPVTDKLIIEGEWIDEITILNLVGQEMMKVNHQNKSELDVSQLSPGMYLLATSNGLVIGEFVKH